ncbi:MAG: cobalamin-dependent protein [Chloroflexota bacterium]|nr:cobalamin-dependent protein [Chloroflexota bacterium]
MEKIKKKRILMAKLGIDAHDIGVKTVTGWLRDAGLEVIYTGPFQTPEKVISSAIQEDVDAIGLSFIGGEHLIYTPRVVNLMREKGVNIPLVVGGVIPRQDIPVLKEMGVREVFDAGTHSALIIDSFKALLE